MKAKNNMIIIFSNYEFRERDKHIYLQREEYILNLFELRRVSAEA